MRTKQDFQECIETQNQRILKIRLCKDLSEEEKTKLVNECMEEIEKINRLQLAIMHRELRRTKRTQFIHLQGYETLLLS